MPGHLHPSDGPRHRVSRAESAMHQALARGLPDGWHAWHSLRLRHGDDWEGEGGGQVELLGGRWYHNGQQTDRSPRGRALTFEHHLAEALREHSVKKAA